MLIEKWKGNAFYHVFLYFLQEFFFKMTKNFRFYNILLFPSVWLSSNIAIVSIRFIVFLLLESIAADAQTLPLGDSSATRVWTLPQQNFSSKQYELESFSYWFAWRDPTYRGRTGRARKAKLGRNISHILGLFGIENGQSIYKNIIKIFLMKKLKKCS